MPDTRTITKPGTSTKPKEPQQPRQWNVVLIDDDEHSYQYVIEMVQQLFGHNKEKAFLLAKTVDSDGRAICLTTHKEHAELKRDQILAFGKDPYMAISKGSMTAIIEPAEFGGDDDINLGPPGRNNDKGRA
jgi:ATP-dependent Clp protease adaptor protein ClpS